MAVMENSLLRDLFQNNIDFVAKQVGRILDSLYGDQANENSTLPNDNFLYKTTQYIGAGYNEILSSGTWSNQVSTYTIVFDNNGFHLTPNGEPTFLTTDGQTQSQIDNLNNQVKPYLESLSYEKTLSELGLSHFWCDGSNIRGKTSEGYLTDIGLRFPFGINTNQVCRWDSATIYTNKQTATLENRDPFTFWYFDNLELFVSQDDRLDLYSIGDDNPTNFVLYPSSDSRDTYNIINDYTNTVNNGGDTIYNYYNDNGDIVINGGGVGGGGAVIAPVGGLAYADVKLILDSLIDDLNLRFDFGGNGGTPLSYAPTWEELHYIDQGSFYITPIKQIDKLPLAPDIADTVVDVSDYVDLLGGASTALFSMLDGFGLSLMATFTFLSVLVIRHLKR